MTPTQLTRPRAAALLALALAAPALPGAAAAQDFGAIAVSPATGQWGWAQNYRTGFGARHRALSECRSATGDVSCRVAVWFTDGCGALAAGPDGWGADGWGAGRGATRAAAEAAARAACGGAARGCTVRLTTCSP